MYKGPEGESTKWDDIQRKLGNKPAKVGRLQCRLGLPALPEGAA